MIDINLATLFPNMCLPVLNCSILNRAAQFNLVKFNVFDIRDFAFNKHNSVDDLPYGGGDGMLLMAEPIFKCYEHVLSKTSKALHVIYTSPKGAVFNQKKALELSRSEKSLLFVCGHYEGIDQRVIDEIVDEEISIGDYIITGGELAALVIIDSIVRLIPGVLPKSSCYEKESHFNGMLEYPQYTRPQIWHNKKVPDVLLSGHHANIENWKKTQSYDLTKKNRPDLLKKVEK